MARTVATHREAPSVAAYFLLTFYFFKFMINPIKEKYMKLIMIAQLNIAPKAITV